MYPTDVNPHMSATDFGLRLPGSIIRTAGRRSFVFDTEPTSDVPSQQ